MAFFSLNLDRYREWTIEQLYRLLFSRLARDFVYRTDYETTFASGNVMAGDSLVTFTVIQPSNKTFADVKAQEYEALAEAGDVSLASAQESGTTSGIERE